jgi:hypothetical protein
VARSRRQFLKNASIGAASFAAGHGIFFPKPSDAVQINYVLSLDGRLDAIYERLFSFQIASGRSEILFPDTPEGVRTTVEMVQASMTARNFDQEQTPYTRRFESVLFPTWGRLKLEKRGPNPGFGTTQFTGNNIVPIAYSGATTIGIDTVLTYITGNLTRQFSGPELDALVMPKNLLFDNQSGIPVDDGNYWDQIINISYESVAAEVSVRYDPPGVYDAQKGRIQYIVRGGQIYNGTITIDVEF